MLTMMGLLRASSRPNSRSIVNNEAVVAGLKKYWGYLDNQKG
jgi:hypothetical protein